MKNPGGNFVVLNIAAVALISAFGAQSAIANDHSFRDFAANNPGLDKRDLRQMWRNQKDDVPGIGFGIMPIADKPNFKPTIPVPSIVSTPGTGPNPVPSFKAFKASYPGMDARALRRAWNQNDPTKIGLGLIKLGGAHIKNSDLREDLVSFEKFKELNPGIDDDALEHIYNYIQSGGGREINFGVISSPPPPPGTSVSGAPPIVVQNVGSVLNNPAAFGAVNLVTRGK